MTDIISTPQVEDLDVIIIGAGISGINSAYRFKSIAPNERYAILEGRSEIGGTWDLFDYPGVRSDSDFFTFGFAWWPWTGKTTMATKAAIINYFKEAIEAKGFGDKFRFRHHVLNASWNSTLGRWSLDVQVNGDQRKQFTAKWIMFGTGYYDMDTPRAAIIPGIDNFKGQVIHPQFWPKELDYTGKEIALIGSGATAVTLLPSMAKTAKRVTMIQRSPTYIFPLSNSMDPISSFARWILPTMWGATLMRWRWVMFGYLFFFFCKNFPARVRTWMLGEIKTALGGALPVDPHFSPRYKPGEQRLCMVPDGDFFQPIREGRATMVTGKIKNVSEDSLRMENGQEVKADIIVTATGLKLRFGGNIAITIDGKPYEMGQKHVWKGVLLEDLPNACISMGYTTASATLGIDASAHMFVRLVKQSHKSDIKSVTPRLPIAGFGSTKSIIDIDCTYVNDGMMDAPITGSEGPWRARGNYFYDMNVGKFGNLEKDLEIVRY